jgi:hypothetical protein
VSNQQTDDTINLIHLATVSVAGGDRYRIDDGPFGNRVIAGIREGRWEGERLPGRLSAPVPTGPCRDPVVRCCLMCDRSSRPTMGQSCT